METKTIITAIKYLQCCHLNRATEYCKSSLHFNNVKSNCKWFLTHRHWPYSDTLTILFSIKSRSQCYFTVPHEGRMLSRPRQCIIFFSYEKLTVYVTDVLLLRYSSVSELILLVLHLLKNGNHPSSSSFSRAF